MLFKIEESSPWSLYVPKFINDFVAIVKHILTYIRVNSSVECSPVPATWNSGVVGINDSKSKRN